MKMKLEVSVLQILKMKEKWMWHERGSFTGMQVDEKILDAISINFNIIKFKELIDENFTLNFG